MTRLVLPSPRPSSRQTLRRGRWVLGVVIVATLLLIACGSSILGTDPDTGFDILVTRGPIQPVAREGEDNSAPVGDATVRIRRTDGPGDARVRTDEDGTVRALLIPGTYRVEVRDCPGAMSLPSPQDAVVSPGELTSLEFSCDTGIR